MEKQYYDLIISLIEKHSKYPGHEAILQEIAEDVFQHARVVITSVTNEDVVLSYLNKVVSNSIVTVGKKHNIKVRHRHTVTTVLSSIDRQQDCSIQEVQQISQPTKTIIENNNSEIVEANNLNSVITEDVIEESFQQSEGDLLTDSQTDSDELTEDEFVDKLYLDTPTTDLYINEEIPTANESVITEEPQDSVVDEIKPDMDLVEKMINGVSEESVTDIDASLNNDNTIDSLNEIDDIDVLVDEVVENELTNIDEESLSQSIDNVDAVEFARNVALDVVLDDNIVQNNDTEACVADAEVEELVEDTPDYNLDENVEILGIEDVDNNAEDSSELFVEENSEVLDIAECDEEEIIDDNAELLTEENSEVLDLAECDEEEIIDDNTELLTEENSDVLDLVESDEEEIIDDNAELLAEENSDVLDLENSNEDLIEADVEVLLDDGSDVFELVEDSESFTLDTDNAVELDNIVEEDNPVLQGSSQSNSKFAVFSFDVENINSSDNSEEILSMLTELDRKHPDYKVLEIAEMKYSSNLSISDIAKKLSFNEDKVIEILNEIIDIVKD